MITWPTARYSVSGVHPNHMLDRIVPDPDGRWDWVPSAGCPRHGMPVVRSSRTKVTHRLASAPAIAIAAAVGRAVRIRFGGRLAVGIVRVLGVGEEHRPLGRV